MWSNWRPRWSRKNSEAEASLLFNLLEHKKRRAWDGAGFQSTRSDRLALQIADLTAVNSIVAEVDFQFRRAGK
jgi:hypothetical protein